MSYQSPIGLIMSDMQVKMEGEILKAVQNIGVNIDKEELLKALKYDRNQYKKDTLTGIQRLSGARIASIMGKTPVVQEQV